ncbi:arginine--tRNA ligase, chloroplastic/mitochondrial, partial [Tanacetum coccineum]
VLRSCCFAALPHILCKYLYNLAEIFNRYFVSTFALGWRTGCFLLLCEATSVVMEKCFHLLEITPLIRGLRSDGWTLTYLPDDLNVELFRRFWSDPINILNGGYLRFGDPSCSRSVPFSSVMEIEMDIVAMKEEEDDFYPICSCRYDLDFSKFLDSELDGWCDSSTVKGKGGQARINYILLRDAVDATIEITFNTRLENLKVHG